MWTILRESIPSIFGQQHAYQKQKGVLGTLDLEHFAQALRACLLLTLGILPGPGSIPKRLISIA